MIIIISAPSGCGKSSVTKRLLELDSNLVLSVSVTTRAKRADEQEGIDYFFRTREEFSKLEFLETAEIYGNLYGTPLDYIKSQLKNNKNILFDIDWQGAKQIIESMPDTNILSIFLLPPSIQELKKRLELRGQDSAETIELRLKAAEEEISCSKYYEYVIINDDFEQTVQNIYSLIKKTRDQQQ